MIPKRLRPVWVEAESNTPTDKWQHGLLAGALVILAAIDTYIYREDTIALGWRITAAGWPVVLAVSLPWRRSHPHILLAVLWIGQLVAIAAAVLPNNPIAIVGLSALIAQFVLTYSLARWSGPKESTLAVAAIAAPELAFMTQEPNLPAVEIFVDSSFWLLPAALGTAMRWRAYGRNRLVEQIQAREREQLAREIHDTVAHHVSAISVQAQAGRTLAKTDGDIAVEALAGIELTAAQTLAEMKAMVIALRDGEPTLSPQAGVANIKDLSTVIEDDLAIDFEIVGDVYELAPTVDTALYRITQEAITNVSKHAVNGTSVVVRLAADPTSIHLTIGDDGDLARETRDPTTGFGILGMKERANLMGGTFSAGPNGRRGWVVEATLPRNGVAK